MDLVEVIRNLDTVEDIELIESVFELGQDERDAAFHQRLTLLYRDLNRDLDAERRGVNPELYTGWSVQQREAFDLDWDDDTFVSYLPPTPEPVDDGSMAEPEYVEPPQPPPSHVTDHPNQLGEGKRKRVDVGEPSKRGRPEEYFTVNAGKRVNVRKFRTTGTDYTVQFKPLDVHGVANVMSTLNNAFQQLFDHLTTDMAPHDQVRLIMNSQQLDRPISLPFLQRDRLTPERFLAAVERVVQSNEQFTLNDPVTVNVVHVAMPQGGRGRKRGVVNLEAYLNKKRCLVQIKNHDQLCCARAIVVAKAKYDNDPQYKSLVSPTGTLQGRLAHDLHDVAGVPLGPCGIEEIKRFQAVLPGYQLNIVSKEHLNAIIYSGPPADKNLYLYHHDHHYDVITTMPAFVVRSKYCHTCKKGYDHIIDHPCGDLCKLCNTQNCPIVAWKPCGDCNRFFKSDACYDRHKVGQGAAKSLCQSLVKCNDCQRVVTRSSLNDHHCGKVRCFVCSKFVDPQNHQCYLQPVVTRETNNDEQRNDDLLDDDMAVEDVADRCDRSLMFFDFECTQDDGRHVPNLCVVQDEAGEETVFSGPSTQEDFCEWLFQPANAKTIFVAHNFQAYDGYFILQYLYGQGIKPELITRGAKILSLTVTELDIKFIDSLCFIPMRLADFPKTFGLGELQKGYFPHFFNRAENQEYVGPMPAVEFYDPDGMSPADREKFLAWYNDPERQNHVFDFKAEILRYCQSDVDILRRCCLEFRELFQQITDIDPFASCLTIASACNLVFRKTFLQEDTIAVIPPSGYKPEHKQSVVALKMLAWIAQRDNIAIQHARNHGEYRVGKYLVDGFSEETNTVWEVQGCLWHGCERCYSRDTVNPVNKLSMQDLRQRTLEKVQLLKDRGFNVVEIWTCDIERELAADPEMKEFFDTFEISEPLEPRQAFFGGRTNATRLFHHVEEGEKVRYVDFCSLYPWCNKYGEYPLGHPTIITENFAPIDQYFGMVKCSVLPPRGLYHPVLPHRTQGKLMFPLCRTCADTLQQKPCNHSDAERTLHGTWVTLELQKALEKGYQLVKVDEVWHFEEHTDGLFKDYIDTFLKIKQEASGYPSECTTEEQKAQYVADYAAHEGIQLDPRQTVKNPGLRALSKLMLNSFWGKFAQRPNMAKVKIISDPAEYFDLLTSDKVMVTDANFINDGLIEVHYENVDEFVEADGKTNVVIAAFTTAHARLKLYGVLERLDRRVLYFDTDSVIYVSKEGEWEPPIGSYLGDLTDELDDGAHITTFVSGGPKNYAYETSQDKTVCKVRGITLNYRTVQKLDFNVICDMVYLDVLCDVSDVLPVNIPFKIIRDKKSKNVLTKRGKKDYRIVYNKRKIVDSFDTLPYGF